MATEWVRPYALGHDDAIRPQAVTRRAGRLDRP